MDASSPDTFRSGPSPDGPPWPSRRGLSLCLGSWPSQEQQRRHCEAQHCERPDRLCIIITPPLPNSNSPKTLPTYSLPYVWGSPVCRTRMRGGAGAIVVHSLRDADSAVRYSCWYKARVVVGQASQTVSEAPGCSGYLHGFSCLHALSSHVWPSPRRPIRRRAQSSTILGSTITSMYTSKSGMISNCSNL